MSDINFITRIGQVLLAVAATGVSVLVLQLAMLAARFPLLGTTQFPRLKTT